MKKTVIISMSIVFFVFTLNVQAIILNPGFESVYQGTTPGGNFTGAYSTWNMPYDWSWRKQGYMEGFSLSASAHTEGAHSLYLFASNVASHYTGDFLEYFQHVDLTETQTILFDVSFYTAQPEFTTSYVAIGSQKVWVRDNTVYDQTLYDVPVDVSSFTGFHELTFGIEVYKDYEVHNSDGHINFDNLRTIEIPEPCTLLTLALGFGFVRRRRRKG